MTIETNADWFSNCGGWQPRHDVRELRVGIEKALLNAQDEYGMTALSLAASSGWKEGVDELLRAGADTELYYFRTGETALYLAVREKNEAIIAALVQGGANPDAANHWGVTARRWHPASFEHVPVQGSKLPDPRIQNAEHLADHHHPQFEIPERGERETLQAGQAVDLYVYGPKSESKQDSIKVRITSRRGVPPHIRYIASVETPIEQTHLTPGTQEVEFGPENVATVYVPRA